MSLETPSPFFDETTLNAERMANLQSMIANYERRINRLSDEHKLLEKLTEAQLFLADKLGIKDDTLAMSPEYQKRDGERENKTTFYNSVEQCEIDEENESISSDNMPIVLSAFFNSKISMKIDKIGAIVETWKKDKRFDFFSSIFAAMNEIPFYLGTISALLESDSIQMMAESVESLFPKTLSFRRSILYTHDASNSRLVIEKQKLRMHHNLSDGLIASALKRNECLFLEKSNPGIRDDDLAVLHIHQNAYFVPIPDANLVLAVFDKSGNFSARDDLLVKSLASAIAEVAHVLVLRKRKRERVLSFQGMNDIFLQLSAINDMKNFLYTINKTVETQFSCRYSQLFRVSHGTNSFSRLSLDGKLQKSCQIGFGIVGYSIAKKTPMAFPRPELSVLFQLETDRPKLEVHCKSILVCPIFDENNDVRWALALYNKIGADVFSNDDIISLGILCENLHPVISSVAQMSKDSNSMMLSTRAMDDLYHIVDIIQFLPGLTDLTDIANQFSQKMSTALKFDTTNVYIVDHKSRYVYGINDEDEQYQNTFAANVEDPIVKLAIANQIREKKPSSATDPPIVFCPLIGTNGSVIAMAEMSVDADGSMLNNRSSMMFMSMGSITTKPFEDNKNRLQKKIAAMNSNRNSDIVPVKNQRINSLLRSWSTVIGSCLESAVNNRENNIYIITEQRAMDTLASVAADCATQIWEDLDALIFSNSSYSDDLMVLPCTRYNADIQNGFTSVMYGLNRFAGTCRLLDFRVENENPDAADPSFFTNSFPLTNTYDVLSLSELDINRCVLSTMKNLGIVDFFSFNEIQIQTMLNQLRRMHRHRPFSNWKLSVDRVQYLEYFMKQTKTMDSITPVQRAALFFHMLAMNAVIEDTSILCRTKRCLEGLGNSHTATVIFIVMSSVMDNPFFSMDPDHQTRFWTSLKAIEAIDHIEQINGSDLMVLTASICRFSYLSRSLPVAQRFVTNRFAEEYKDEPAAFHDDLTRYQLEFEIRMLVHPAFNEIANQGFRIEVLKRQIIDNVSKITGINI